MQKQNQNGSSSVIAIILLSILLIAAAGFGGWAFMGRQDYKNNTDKKIAEAVSAAKSAQAKELNEHFAEESKNPNKTYQGSATFGSVSFKYPKTWSAYVDESNSSNPINGYFHPDKVPGTQTGAGFALRVELIATPYTNAIKQFDSEAKQGKVKAAAYVPPKMNGVANVQPGMRFDGAIDRNKTGDQQGFMVILPVRDKTLKIYTLSNNFLADYNNIVLANLAFTP